jgi:hypothetical protein
VRSNWKYWRARSLRGDQRSRGIAAGRPPRTIGSYCNLSSRAELLRQCEQRALATTTRRAANQPIANRFRQAGNDLSVTMLAHENRNLLAAMTPDERKELSVPERKNEWDAIRSQAFDRFPSDDPITPGAGQRP